MERTIEIDGVQVPFKATARTPVMYRALFGKDLFKDLVSLTKVAKNGDEAVLDEEVLETFLHIAYCMAKQADKSIPSIEEWLDQFSMFSIYQVLPDLLQLWNLNMMQISESKKKIETLTGK